MSDAQSSQEAPSRLLQVLHGFWGAGAGLALGWLLTTQLPPLAPRVAAVLIASAAILGAVLAFRFGAAFWHALMVSIGQAGG